MGNLALACQGCNSHKHTKTEALDPVTKSLAPLYDPRRQRWSDHFGWNNDYTQIVGLSPTGRATTEALHLNRGSLINLRQILTSIEEHPPIESVDEPA